MLSDLKPRILSASPFPSMKPQPAELSGELILISISYPIHTSSPQAPHILSPGPLRVRRSFQKPTLCINPIFLRDGGHGPTLGHFSSLQQPSPFRGVQPKGQQHMADLGSHLWSRDWLTTSTIARSCLYPQSTWKVCDTGANTRD